MAQMLHVRNIYIHFPFVHVAIFSPNIGKSSVHSAHLGTFSEVAFEVRLAGYPSTWQKFLFSKQKKQIPLLVLGGLSHLPVTVTLKLTASLHQKTINGLEDDRLSFQGFCLLSRAFRVLFQGG